MKAKIMNLLRILSGVALAIVVTASVANAQQAVATNTDKADAKDAKKTTKTDDKQPAKADDKKSAKKTADDQVSSANTGESAGNFTITSSLEFGYRGQRVDGDINKFKSDLNYKAGPRLFDTSFLMKSKTDGKGELFDTFLVTSTGWGADASGTMRFDVEKPEWYRFEGQYRRFKYYRFLNNLANPTWLFSPIPTNANPVTGLHGFNTRTEMGDFDLTILPKNELIRFSIGYSPERYDGPSYTDYHNGGNDFWLLNNLRSRSDDWRLGADGKVGIVDWTFVQGFRRFREDSVIPSGVGLNINNSSSVAQLSSFLRQEPTRGTVDYTRFSVHSLINNKLDITGRGIYSKGTANSTYIENFSGRNFNFRITGFPPTVTGASATSTTNPSFYNIAADVKRPSHVVDFGITYLASDKLRISNLFHEEAFSITGADLFSDFFSVNRTVPGGSRTDTFSVNNVPSNKITHYSKYQDTVEGDYQINRNYSVHFGYRFGHRHDIVQDLGFAINSNSPTLITDPTAEIDQNNTNVFFGGFRARPKKDWTIYFDAEHGSADNIFTRIGNYNYTNVRAKSRFSVNKNLHLNLGFILRDNSNPSEIAGESLNDFGVNLKTRVFTSSVDWMVNPHVNINAGYNYNWVNSDAVIQYYYQQPPAASLFHPNGHGLYFQRLNYFFLDMTARLNRRMTLYTSYRLNQDGGQGNRISDPVGGPAIAGGVIPPGGSSPVASNNGGTLITSYPMTFNSPEARLAIMINRHLDWNLGYQYYSYNENNFLKTFPGSLRAQNYHAHLPYMSVRWYIGRKE